MAAPNDPKAAPQEYWHNRVLAVERYMDSVMPELRALREANAKLVHGLRCIAADGGTQIDRHGSLVLCDGRACAELAEEFLQLANYNVTAPR